MDLDIQADSNREPLATASGSHWLPQMVLLSLLLRAGKNTIPFKLGLTKRNSQMPHPNSATNNQRIPLAYLITFRSYGTWLHGDERGSVDRFHNVYGTPRLPPNEQRKQYEERLLAMPPVKLNSRKRAVVEAGIRETCAIRKWLLWAFNIRTNHVHTVVSANSPAWQVLNALKANATRSLRESGCWRSERSPWARRGSKRRLWTDKQVADAIAYVLYDQGEPLP